MSWRSALTKFMDEWQLVEPGVLALTLREGPAEMIRIEGGPIESRREQELTVVDGA